MFGAGEFAKYGNFSLPYMAIQAMILKYGN